MNSFKIKANDRVFLAGQTGSGKTHLAINLLKNANRLVVIDSKHNLADKMDLERHSTAAMRKLFRGKDARVQIKIPTVSDKALNIFFDNVFEQIFKIGNLIVYVDEVYAVTRSAHYTSKYFNAIYTRGREVANVGIWSSVQRPSNIPLYVMTESEHSFIFRLQAKIDRDKIRNNLGFDAIVPHNNPHGFFYYNNTLSAPIYYSEL